MVNVERNTAPILPDVETGTGNVEGIVGDAGIHGRNGEVTDPQQQRGNSAFGNDNQQIDGSYPNSGMATTSISFADKNRTSESSLSNMEDLSMDELEILELINNMKFEMLDSVLEAFDEMLERTRELMEQYKEYVQEVVIPREEIQEDQMMAEAVQEASARAEAERQEL